MAQIVLGRLFQLFPWCGQSCLSEKISLGSVTSGDVPEKYLYLWAGLRFQAIFWGTFQKICLRWRGNTYFLGFGRQHLPVGNILMTSLLQKLPKQAKQALKLSYWKYQTHIQWMLVSSCSTPIEPFNIGCERLHPDKIENLSVPPTYWATNTLKLTFLPKPFVLTICQ